MTDLEMTRLCAEAMGYREYANPDQRAPKPIAPCILVLKIDENATRELYDPLHDDAQAMELVRKFRLHVRHNTIAWLVDCPSDRETGTVIDVDLCRAIVACVAMMKSTSPIS